MPEENDGVLCWNQYTNQIRGPKEEIEIERQSPSTWMEIEYLKKWYPKKEAEQ